MSEDNREEALDQICNSSAPARSAVLALQRHGLAVFESLIMRGTYSSLIRDMTGLLEVGRRNQHLGDIVLQQVRRLELYVHESNEDEHSA